MKKAFILFALLIILLGLVGCDPGWRNISEKELLENTVKIELYYYENTTPKLLNLNGKNTPIFDFSKAAFLASLEESRFEDVIKDISGQTFGVYHNVLNEPIGKTIILFQENGNMLVLFSCVYTNGTKATRYYGECNLFAENGVFLEHIGKIGSEYVDLLESIYFGNSA